MIGFAAGPQYTLANRRPVLGVGNLKLERWNPATSAYDLTEHADGFASTSVSDFARSGNPAGA
jgi:hypothetical protein